MDQKLGSKDVASAALQMSLTPTREEENKIKKQLAKKQIHAAAVNYGGEFITSANKIIERAVVAAKRENIIDTTHLEEGAVAGAAREAIAQIVQKAIGYNVGGKIGIARCGEHVSVAIFFGIGMLHLNEVAVGVGHRVV